MGRFGCNDDLVVSYVIIISLLLPASGRRSPPLLGDGRDSKRGKKLSSYKLLWTAFLTMLYIRLFAPCTVKYIFRVLLYYTLIDVYELRILKTSAILQCVTTTLKLISKLCKYWTYKSNELLWHGLSCYLLTQCIIKEYTHEYTWDFFRDEQEWY